MNNDYITIAKRKIVREGMKLDILKSSEVIVKEKTDDYIIIYSSDGITEVRANGTINLFDKSKEIKINKGESKTVTLPVTDYSDSVTIKY